MAATLQRLNRSRVIAVGALLVGAGYGLNAVARGPGTFAIGVVVWTVGEILVLPIGNAVVADVAPSHMRGRYQGTYGLSFGMAGFVAPLAGTWIMEQFGTGVLWMSCLGIGLAVAAGHLMLEPALSRLRHERLALRARHATVDPAARPD
jgi:MFS family permease